ncbi:MAG: DUF4838 domain-containing protein [Kiritimatiellia bacterium]
MIKSSSLKSVILLLAALTFALSAQPQLVENNALPPVETLKAESHAPLKLVENNEIRFAIVGGFKAEADVRGPEEQTLRKFSRDSVKRAANALAECFQKCTGMKPAVLEADDPKAANYPYVISVGKTKWSEALGMKPDKLPREGFEVRTFEKGVAIAGMDGFSIPGFYDLYNWRCSRFTCNGTEWGAVDFCERFLGFRQFATSKDGLWDVTPACADLTLAPCAYKDHPRYLFRSGYAGENARAATSTDFFGGEAPHPYDLAKAHPDRIEDMFFRDSLGTLWYDPQVYSKNYFDITDTKLADILVDDFKQYYAQNGTGTYWKASHAPSTRYLWFGQCDRGMKMDTPRAKQHLRENAIDCDVTSELVGHFNSHLAQRVAAELPGKTLVLMAYSTYLKAPRTIEKFPDNVQILACIGTPALVRSEAYMREVEQVYADWNALCAPDKKCVPYLYLLNYSENGGPVPQLMTGVFAGEFFKRVKNRTAEGLSYPCIGRFSTKNILAAYLTYRCHWNPDYDVRAGIRDYMTALFGTEAGAHLSRFCDQLVERWTKHYIPAVASDPYLGERLRSIPYMMFTRFYTETLTEEVVKRLNAELDAAEKALENDPERKVRFAEFAQPYRKTFADALGFQRIVYPDFKIGRKPTSVPVFKQAFVGDEPQGPVPTAELCWSDEGLTLDFHSPSPFKDGKHIFDGDSVELFFAPGEDPANLYQFAVGSNGIFEDYHKQIDQPRKMDHDWKCRGFVCKTEHTDTGWKARLFIPWTGLFDAPPRKGDIWKVNIISNRTSPAETTSLSPTLNNNRWNDLYGKMRFND